MHNNAISIVGYPTEPVLSIGCYDNDECPLFNACENTKCINPCAERNPCAPSAICKVINHEPECTCPDGFIGSPLTDCRPRKYLFLSFQSIYLWWMIICFLEMHGMLKRLKD